MKKYLITFLIIFHQFTSGYWFIGFSVPQSTAIALDSNNICVRYTGETSECSSSDRFFLQYLHSLEIYNQNEEYTHIKE